jgi:hypothetical protein
MQIGTLRFLVAKCDTSVHRVISEAP